MSPNPRAGAAVTLVVVISLISGCASVPAASERPATPSPSATPEPPAPTPSAPLILVPAFSAVPSPSVPSAAPTLIAAPLAPPAPPSAAPPPPSAAPPALSGLAPTGPIETASVLRVIDGDTIEVSIDGRTYRVRYIGIDTPETVHPSRPVEPMGPEASAANAALVGGRTVVLEKDVSETDRFGRLLRYVWIEEGSSWTLVNLELLRRGLATVTTYPPDVKYVDALYLPAQQQARAEGLGIWAP